MLIKDCWPPPSSVNGSGNDTTALPPANYSYVDVIIYIIYAIQGLTMSVGGSAIALSILYYAALRHRKENIMILSVTTFPILEGLAILMTSLYRVPIWMARRDQLPTTRMYCWLIPYSHMFTMALTPTALAQTVVAVDRLLLVLDPLRHRQRGASYAWSCFGGCAAHGVLLWFVSGVQAWQTRDQCDEGATEICWASASRRPLLDNYNYIVSMCGNVVGIVIMAVALLLFIRRSRQKTATNSLERNCQEQLAKQRKLMVSFAISATYTLLLYVIPINMYTVLGWFPECRLCDWVRHSMWTVINCNSILNIYIFLARHKEIRVGLSAVIKGKEMPPHITNWNID